MAARIASLALWLCAILLPTWTHAHRSDAAMSLVEINARSQELEVTHTLYAHDLEGALLAGAVSLAWLESQNGQEALRSYCLRQFILTDQSSQLINLDFVGTQLRGGVINVFFTAPRFLGTGLIIDSNLLQDVNENQVNQVNVRANGVTNSLLFEQGASPKRLNLVR